MKVATTIPIYKSCSNRQFNNYGPIALLSQLSKILEKLYNKRLEHFFDDNNVLSNSQCGVHILCPIPHALIDLVKEISTSMDK